VGNPIVTVALKDLWTGSRHQKEDVFTAMQRWKDGHPALESNGDHSMEQHGPDEDDEDFRRHFWTTPAHGPVRRPNGFTDDAVSAMHNQVIYYNPDKDLYVKTTSNLEQSQSELQNELSQSMGSYGRMTVPIFKQLLHELETSTDQWQAPAILQNRIQRNRTSCV
jgi:hypothetical protein